MAFGKKLGLNDININIIKFNHISKGNQEQCHLMLEQWKKKYADKATLQTIYSALQQLGRDDVISVMNGTKTSSSFEANNMFEKKTQPCQVFKPLNQKSARYHSKQHTNKPSSTTEVKSERLVPPYNYENNASTITPHQHDQVRKKVAEFLQPQAKPQDKKIQVQNTEKISHRPDLFTDDLTESYLRNVSNTFTNDSWIELGKLLGIKQMKISLFKFTHIDKGISETCFQMLLTWMKTPDNAASTSKLQEALKKLKHLTYDDNSIEQKTVNTSNQFTTNPNLSACKLEANRDTDVNDEENTETKSTLDENFDELMSLTEVRKQRKSHIEREFHEITPDDIETKRKSLIDQEFSEIVPEVTDDCYTKSKIDHEPNQNENNHEINGKTTQEYEKLQAKLVQEDFEDDVFTTVEDVHVSCTTPVKVETAQVTVEADRLNIDDVTVMSREVIGDEHEFAAKQVISPPLIMNIEFHQPQPTDTGSNSELAGAVQANVANDESMKVTTSDYIYKDSKQINETNQTFNFCCEEKQKLASDDETLLEVPVQTVVPNENALDSKNEPNLSISDQQLNADENLEPQIRKKDRPTCQINEEFKKLITEAELENKRSSDINRQFQQIIPDESEQSRKSVINREFLKIVPSTLEMLDDRPTENEAKAEKEMNASSPNHPSNTVLDEQKILSSEKQTFYTKSVAENSSKLKHELVTAEKTNETYTAKMCHLSETNFKPELMELKENEEFLENSDSEFNQISNSSNMHSMTEAEVSIESDKDDLKAAAAHDEKDIGFAPVASNNQNKQPSVSPIKAKLASFYKLQQLYLDRYQVCQANWQDKTLQFQHPLKDVYLSSKKSVNMYTIPIQELFQSNTSSTSEKILVTTPYSEIENSFISKLILDWFRKESYIWPFFDLIIPLDLMGYEDDLESMMIKQLDNILSNCSLNSLDILTICQEKTLLLLYNFTELRPRDRKDFFRNLNSSSCPYTVILITNPYEMEMTHHDIDAIQSTGNRSSRSYDVVDNRTFKFWDKHYEIEKISDSEYETLLAKYFDIDRKHVRQISETLGLKVNELNDQSLVLELSLHATKLMNGIHCQSKTELFNLLFGFITNDSKVLCQIKEARVFTMLDEKNQYFKDLQIFGELLWKKFRDNAEESITYENIMLKKSEIEHHLGNITPFLKMGILVKNTFSQEKKEEYFELLHPTFKEYLIAFHLTNLSKVDPCTFKNECMLIFSNQFKHYYNCLFFNFLGGLMDQCLGQLLRHIKLWSYCLLVNKYPLRELLCEVTHIDSIVNDLIPFFPSKWHIRPADLRQEREDLNESMRCTSFASLRMKIGNSLLLPEFSSVVEMEEPSIAESSVLASPEVSPLTSVDHLLSVPKYPPKWNVCSYDFYTSSLHEFLVSIGLETNSIKMLILNPLEVSTLPSDVHVNTLILIIDSSELKGSNEVTIPQNMSCEDLMLLINKCTDEEWNLCLNVVNSIKAARINVIIASQSEINIEALSAELEKEKWKNLRFHSLKVFEIVEEKGRITISLIENLLKRGRIVTELEIHLQHWRSQNHYSTEIKREHVESILNAVANVGTLKHFCIIGDKECKCVDNASLYMNNFFNKFRQWKTFYVDGKLYFQSINNTEENLPVKSFGFNNETGLGNKANVLKKHTKISKLQYCTATFHQLLNKLPEQWNGYLTLTTLHLDVTQPSTTNYSNVSDIPALPNLETLILDFKNIFNFNEVSPMKSLVQAIFKIKKLVVKTVRKWNISYVETFIQYLLKEKTESLEPMDTISSYDSVYFKKEKQLSLHEIKVWFDQKNYIGEEMLESFFQKIRMFMYKGEVETFTIIEPNKYLKQVGKMFPITGKFKIERKVEDLEKEEILLCHHQPEYCAVSPEKLCIEFFDNNEMEEEITV